MKERGGGGGGGGGHKLVREEEASVRPHPLPLYIEQCTLLYFIIIGEGVRIKILEHVLISRRARP